MADERGEKVGSLQRLSLYRYGFWGRGDCVLYAELSPFHGMGLGGGDSVAKGAGTGKRCLPQRILFLDASEEWLRKNKEGDETRSREFFEYYVKHLMPLKRKWFSGRPDVDFLKTDGMTVEEMGHAVKEWVEEQGKR